MANNWITTVLLLLSITVVANTQYYDLLQSLQKLLQPYQPHKPTQNNGDVNRQTTDKHYNKPKPDERRYDEQIKKKHNLNLFDIFATTTKPSRKTTKSSSQSKVVSNTSSNKNSNLNTGFIQSNYEITTKSNRHKSTSTTTANNSRTHTTTARTTTENISSFNLNTRPIPDNVDNQKGDKYIAGTTYYTNNNSNNRPTTNNNNGISNKPEGNRNVNVANLDTRRITNDISKTRTSYIRQIPNFGFVTQNPFLSQPGVRPGLVNSPPITNRPISDSIFFPNSGAFVEPESPELLIGPDEDDMTSLQRRRYVDLAERMCDRYKALNIKKLVALPPSLIPSQDPVEFNVTSCTRYSIPLVIGGKIADITEFPHMALVGWKKFRIAGYSWKCGGSLVSDQYVLTAGHCTYQDKDSNAVSGLPHVIQLGSSYLDDAGAQVVKIASVIRHPKYKRSRAYHDVAIVKMVKRVSFSEVIKPACVGVAPAVGKKIIATGWGRTEFGGDNSRELRSVSLPIWDMRECRSVWGTSFKLPNGPTPDSHVCAGDRSGEKDTCQGDSGGPAQIQDGCVWRVVAVTSIGKSCGAPGTPALYAVVPRAFIAAQVFGEEVDYGGRGGASSNRRGEEYYRD